MKTKKTVTATKESNKIGARKQSKRVIEKMEIKVDDKVIGTLFDVEAEYPELLPSDEEVAMLKGLFDSAPLESAASLVDMHKATKVAEHLHREGSVLGKLFGKAQDAAKSCKAESFYDKLEKDFDKTFGDGPDPKSRHFSDFADSVADEKMIDSMYNSKVISDINKKLEEKDAEFDPVQSDDYIGHKYQFMKETNKHPFFKTEADNKYIEKVRKTPLRPGLGDLAKNEKNQAIKAMHVTHKTDSYVPCFDHKPVVTEAKEILEEKAEIGSLFGANTIKDPLVAEIASLNLPDFLSAAKKLANCADFSKVATPDGTKLNYVEEDAPEPQGIFKEIADAKALVEKFEKSFADANADRLGAKKNLKDIESKFMAGGSSDQTVRDATQKALETKRQYILLKKIRQEAYKQFESAPIKQIDPVELARELEKYVPRPSIQEQLKPMFDDLCPSQEQLERANPANYPKHSNEPFIDRSRQPAFIKR